MKALYEQAAEDLRNNKEQWAAYTATENCVILAGPGSGKTKIITTKIAQLLSEELRWPRRLACITYSNACVRELRVRLGKLGVEDGNQLLLSTVHSFCLTELVLPYARLAGIDIPNPLKIARSFEGRELFRQAYLEVLGGELPRWYRTPCDRLRRTVLDREAEAWVNWPGQETIVIEKYETLLDSKKLIDFDGLVLIGLRLIEKFDWVRRAIRAKYPIIVIDEYQDLGLPLHRIILSLIKNAGVRVIAVGDPDQSIYGFTGAKPSLLKALGTLKSVRLIQLKLNYRCADQIIAASQAVLSESKEFESHDGREGQIHILQLQRSFKEQAKYALGQIVPALLKSNESWRPGDIALLYRNLNEGALIAEVADELNISYFRVDNGSPIKKSRLTEWLMNAAKWCSGGWKSGSVNLAQVLKSWKLLRRSLAREQDFLSTRAKLISTLFLNRDPNMRLREWLGLLYDTVLQDAFREEPCLADESDIFDELLEAAGETGPLGSFTIEIFGNQGRSPEQINFITLHSSKGLEFQTVIMIGLEEGVFPSRLDQRSSEQIEEASRLFYVGVTRAKNQVFLTYNLKESSFVTAIREATS